MTYAAAHNYMTFHWTPTGITTEGGQFGLRFAGPQFADQNAADAYAASVAIGAKTWWQDPVMNIQPNYNLVSVKVARIGVDGNYVPGAPIGIGAVAQPAVAGGTGGIQFPLQVAAVATLRTGVAVGLAHSGRIYLPPLAGLLSGSQQWTQSMVNAANAKLATFLTTLSGGIVGDLSIMSFGNAATPVGPVRQVTGCQMDGRPDVQRRRAAQIVPSPGTIAVVTS